MVGHKKITPKFEDMQILTNLIRSLHFEYVYNLLHCIP